LIVKFGYINEKAKNYSKKSQMFFSKKQKYKILAEKVKIF